MGFKLSPLSCTRCGAPIREEQADDVISCTYCGQAHVLEKAPPPAPLPAAPAAYPVVRPLWILVGSISLLSGSIFFLASAGPAAPTAATPLAATTALAATNGNADGPGDGARVYAEGQSVDIYWGTSWWPGTIKRKNANATYRITYTGWSTSWDEDVTARRLRARP